ncbi:hypothetical protein MP228_012985 [Amoeboaphelidium protococcarum]|nr:hypothetical protein MP228_012985 [Amoeboaphelidium protococcarum]
MSEPGDIISSDVQLDLSLTSIDDSILSNSSETDDARGRGRQRRTSVKEYYSTPTIVNCMDGSGKWDKELALRILQQEQNLFEAHNVQSILGPFVNNERVGGSGADSNLDRDDAELLLQLRRDDVQDEEPQDVSLDMLLEDQLNAQNEQSPNQDEEGLSEIERQCLRAIHEFRVRDGGPATCYVETLYQYLKSQSDELADSLLSVLAKYKESKFDLLENDTIVLFAENIRVQSESNEEDGTDDDYQQDAQRDIHQDLESESDVVTDSHQLPQDGLFSTYLNRGGPRAAKSILSSIERDFRQSRPVNTQKNYVGPVMEWRKFCSRLKLTDFVYEVKLVAYLRHVVSNIAVRRQINARAKGSSTSHNIMILHTRALVDLWSYQASLFPQERAPRHPREGGVKKLLTISLRSEIDRKRKEYKDKGTQHFNDTYTEEDRLKVSIYFFLKNSSASLRNRMDFLLGDAMLQRGDEKRRILLSDMACRVYPAQSALGPTPAVALVITMNQGKTNKAGRRQYAGCFRALDVKLCPLAATGFYLQHRWYKDAPGTFPDFSSKRLWYDLVLLKSTDDAKSPMTYQTQHQAFSKCFKDLGIKISKVTHANRMAGAQLLEEFDVDRAEIQNHGRWRGDDLETSYLTNLSLKPMRLLSGAQEKGSYYVPRALIRVPDQFKKLVFPDSIRARRVVLDLVQDETDMAAKHFLDLLDKLAEIMCQDAVFLMAEYPASHIWQLQPYCLDSFKEWRELVLEQFAEVPQVYEQDVDISPAIISQYQQVQKQNALLAQRVKKAEDSISSLVPLVQQTHSMLKYLIDAQGFGAAYREHELKKACKVSASSGSAINAFSFVPNPQTFNVLYDEYFGTGILSHCAGVQKLENDGGAYRRGNDSLRKSYANRQPAYAIFESLQLTRQPVATVLENLNVLRGNQPMWAWLKSLKDPDNELWSHSILAPMKDKALSIMDEFSSRSGNQGKSSVAIDVLKDADEPVQLDQPADAPLRHQLKRNKDGQLKVPSVTGYLLFCTKVGKGGPQQWKQLTAQEKQVWNDEAAEERAKIKRLREDETAKTKMANANIRAASK